MKYYSIYDLIGVSVDGNYPWIETLFINLGIAIEDIDAYQKCKALIDIIYTKNIDVSDVRFIGDGKYIGENIFVDRQYGVRIVKTKSKIQLIVSQECNEWLVIAIQLLLLESDYTLIHAAALEKDGKVLMFPSWGGVGKTATVCHFIKKHQWKLLGDDLVIMGKGKIIPFLKPFVIYPYHKELFPELFTSRKNHTIKNLSISNWMSKIIPSVKRILRPFPGVLAYLRKYNPQSMRVNPREIFEGNQLSNGGIPWKFVWLERSMTEQIVYRSISNNVLMSKAITVTSVELFSSRLESVYHMCGCGMLLYDDVFTRMREIILETINGSQCELIEIPLTIEISEVGKCIYNTLGV